MRGDLQNGVAGCVKDRLPGTHMLLAVPFDDVGTRCMAIAQNARNAALGDNRVNQGFGKSRDRLREIPPVEYHRYTCNLPVAGRCVLAL